MPGIKESAIADNWHIDIIHRDFYQLYFRDMGSFGLSPIVAFAFVLILNILTTNVSRSPLNNFKIYNIHYTIDHNHTHFRLGTRNKVAPSTKPS